MAQNNTFRTRRRRLNGRRNSALATARMLGGVKRAAHETLKSAIKRDNENGKA